MGEGDGAGNTSEAETQPPSPAIAGSSRPVFISYASNDAAVARMVCAALGEAGCMFDATKCRVKPAERRYMDVPAGLTSQGWRDARRQCISDRRHA
jgi:hypothetical protein